MSDFTKEAIKASYKKLLEEKSISKITVKDVCADCGVHKNTFYYHFQDLPRLLEDILIEYADEFIRQYPAADSLNDCLSAVLSFIRQNIKVVRHIADTSNSSYLLEKYLWRICEYVSDEYVDIILKKDSISPPDRALLKHSIKCELFGYAADWINTGMREDYTYDVQRLLELKKSVLETIEK